MAADAVGFGGLDDDIAAQVGDLAPVVSFAAVGVLERLVERDLGAGDGRDEPLLGLRVAAVMVFGRGEDDAIAGALALNRLGQCHRGVIGLGRGAEADPGAAHGGAMEIHPAAAADDGRARLLVETRDVG